MTDDVRLVLALDDPLLNDALRLALQGEPDLMVILSTPERVRQAAALGDVVVIGTDLRQSLDVVVSLSGMGHHVLVLVDGPADAELLEAVEAGALGFANAGGSLAELINTVRAAARGEACVPRRLLGGLLRGLVQRRREVTELEERAQRLSPREREVLGLLGAGLDGPDIAQRLFISPETARTHIQRLLKKLGVNSRVAAAQLARDMHSEGMLLQSSMAPGPERR